VELKAISNGRVSEWQRGDEAGGCVEKDAPGPRKGLTVKSQLVAWMENGRSETSQSKRDLRVSISIYDRRGDEVTGPLETGACLR